MEQIQLIQLCSLYDTGGISVGGCGCTTSRLLPSNLFEKGIYTKKSYNIHSTPNNQLGLNILDPKFEIVNEAAAAYTSWPMTRFFPFHLLCTSHS